MKTVSWSHDIEFPKENMTFEYGGLQIFYGAQKQDGSMSPTVVGGWDRVQNRQDTADSP